MSSLKVIMSSIVVYVMTCKLCSYLYKGYTQEHHHDSGMLSQLGEGDV